MCFRLVQTCNILSQPNGTLNEHQHLSRPPFIVSPHSHTTITLQSQNSCPMLEREAKTKTSETEELKRGRRCERSGKNDRPYSDLSVERENEKNHEKIQSGNSSSSKTELKWENKLHTCNSKTGWNGTEQRIL